MRPRAFLLSLLTLLAAPATAQQPLAEWWTQLEQATSLRALNGVPAPATADQQIAEALRLLRRYELGRDVTDAFVSRRSLERIVPGSGSAWAHFALGVTLARGPDVRVSTGGDPTAYFVDANSNAARQAPRSLRRALSLDPLLHEAAFVLAELALDLGDRPLMGEALQALAHPARADSPRGLILRSRILAQLDETGGAVLAARAAREAGADASLAAYHQAAALLRRPGYDVEGTRAYLAGLDALTAAGASAYFESVAAVLSPTDLQRWDAADTGGRADVLRRFWQVHAALAGVPLEQRLAEHYRRLAIVTRNGRAARMGGMAAGDGVHDDVRGIGVSSFSELLLLRHGDPLRDDRVLYCGKEVLDIPLPLAPSPAECARTPVARMRQKNAAAVGAGRLMAMRAADRALPGTTHYPPFETHLHVVHQVLQFRGAGGATSVIASVGVPTESAAVLVRDGVLSVEMQLALIDTATADVVRQDTSLSFRAPSLPASGWVLLASQLASRPGRAQLYRIGVMNPERTAGRVVGGAVDVRDHGTDSLMLSDVLVTPLDGVPSFTRGDVRLSLAPGRSFRRDEDVTLYYEVYGVPARAGYRTEILIRARPDGIADHVRQLFTGAPDAVRLGFDEVADAVHDIFGVQQTRTVGLGGLVPGSYTLRITVTDTNGRVTTRERDLVVVEN